jgi:DNA-directed RNA polymerase specialized sigma24 family protein
MSTPAAAVHGMNKPTSASPAADSLAAVAPLIASQLRRRMVPGQLSAAAALEELYAQAFGAGRTHRERLRFMLFAAPIARRIAIERADPQVRIATTDVTVADVKVWLWWLDSMDPLCARMIDLHYFAGLSIRQTATALELARSAVIRDLRFARSWLTIKLPP